jgi:hypothetical protein
VAWNSLKPHRCKSIPAWFMHVGSHAITCRRLRRNLDFPCKPWTNDTVGRSRHMTLLGGAATSLQSAAKPPSCIFHLPAGSTFRRRLPTPSSISDRAESPFSVLKRVQPFCRPKSDSVGRPRQSPCCRVLSHALHLGANGFDRHSRNAPLGAS